MIIEENGIEYGSEEELLSGDHRSGTTASPFCVGSCFMAVLAGGLLGLCGYMAVSSAGAISVLDALIGLIAVPLTIFGLWLGLTGKNEKEEKRQRIGTVGCVANALLFLVLICIYGVGLL